MRATTGLVIDPYFSGTKLRWLFDNVRGLRARAADLAFGTIDSWLIWKLTGGRAHVTDYTNASRTLLFDIHRRRWDDELLRVLQRAAPRCCRRSCRRAASSATTDAKVCGAEVPIAGIAGDQQAALFGQACFAPGMVKNTYGTGCFLLMFTGDAPVASQQGAADHAGLRRRRPAGLRAGRLGVHRRRGDPVAARRARAARRRRARASAMARAVDSTLGVYVVPAFVGLGTPYWDSAARGAIVGLTRGVTRAHLVRATLESLAFQTRDVVDTMAAESGRSLAGLRVDGGASANDFLMQFQADMLGATVDRPVIVETTALGAALLAGRGVGLWKQRRAARARPPARPRLQAAHEAGAPRGALPRLGAGGGGGAVIGRHHESKRSPRRDADGSYIR